MRYIYLFIIVSLAGSACTRHRVEIAGSVDGGAGNWITLERFEMNRTTPVDSARIGKGENFSFEFRMDQPELYILRYSSGEIINLLPSPGEKLRIGSRAGTFGNGYEVKGSAESENIRVLVEQLALTRTALDSLYRLADSIGNPDSPQMELVRSAYARTIVAQKRFTIRYLVEHMVSLSSVYALYQKYEEGVPVLDPVSDLQYFKAVADSLEASHPASPLTRLVRADIQQRETEIDQQNKMNALLELAEEYSGSPELSIKDREGREVSLSSLKGKVVMVVFWASRNEESIRTLLRLKTTYDKYRDKGFEIYAVSLDNNKLQWMNAVDFNEFDWINVSELNYPDSRANMLYNVSSLPAAYLINKEGDLVARDLYGRRLETWLDNLI